MLTTQTKLGTNLCSALSALSVSRNACCIFGPAGCILCRVQIKYFPYFGSGLCALHHTQIIWFTALSTCGWHELICVSIVCILDSIAFQRCITVENNRVQEWSAVWEPSFHNIRCGAICWNSYCSTWQRPDMSLIVCFNKSFLSFLLGFLSLASWTRFFLNNLIIAHIINKLAPLYWSWKFITVFTLDLDWFPFWALWIHFTSSSHVSLTSFSVLSILRPLARCLSLSLSLSLPFWSSYQNCVYILRCVVCIVLTDFTTLIMSAEAVDHATLFILNYHTHCAPNSNSTKSKHDRVFLSAHTLSPELPAFVLLLHLHQYLTISISHASSFISVRLLPLPQKQFMAKNKVNHAHMPFW
jgi:hypothetical protein